MLEGGKTMSTAQKDIPAENSQYLVHRVNNKKRYLIPKRIFDIIVCLIFGIIILIPMLIVALIIKIESPGPAFYKQERLGKNGKIFMMYKFRSMRTDAEKNGPQWATVDDPRCTKVGKVIRVMGVPRHRDARLYSRSRMMMTWVRIKYAIPIQPVMVSAKTMDQKDADMIKTITAISRIYGTFATTL